MKRVILVTDGDCTAAKAVEMAAKNLGANTISLSGCHKTGDAYLTPNEVEELIMSSQKDLVVVMVDDEGFVGEGRGEEIIRYLSNKPELDILGVVAVASQTKGAKKIHIDCSVDRFGQIHNTSVDKEGNPQDTNNLQGDTTEILNSIPFKVVVGLGDPGKMNYADEVSKNAPITTVALQEVLKRNSL